MSNNLDETSMHLQYLDANNIYGRRMIQKLDQLLEKKRKGHISEIDIKYYKLKRKF